MNHLLLFINGYDIPLVRHPGHRTGYSEPNAIMQLKWSVFATIRLIGAFVSIESNRNESNWVEMEWDPNPKGRHSNQICNNTETKIAADWGKMSKAWQTEKKMFFNEYIIWLFILKKNTWNETNFQPDQLWAVRPPYNLRKHTHTHTRAKFRGEV